MAPRAHDMVLRDVRARRASAWAYLFNSYYEAVGARVERARRGLMTRPGARARSTRIARASMRACSRSARRARVGRGDRRARAASRAAASGAAADRHQARARHAAAAAGVSRGSRARSAGERSHRRAGSTFAGGIVEIGAASAASRSTASGRAIACSCSSRSGSRRGRSATPRCSRSSPTAAIASRGCWLSRRLRDRAARGLDRAALLGAAATARGCTTRSAACARSIRPRPRVT